MVNNCCVWPSTCMFELNFITVMFLFGKRCVWILKNHENVKSWIRICILKSLDVFFLPWRDVFWDTDDISVTGPPEVTKSLESLDRALWVQRLKLTEVNLSFFSSSRLNQWVLLDVPLGQRNCRMTESLVVLTLVGAQFTHSTESYVEDSWFRCSEQIERPRSKWTAPKWTVRKW